MPAGHEWTIPCRDMAGRRRNVTVFVSEGKVVLIAPAGETAVLGPLEVGRLRAALRDAVVGAEDPVKIDSAQVAGPYA